MKIECKICGRELEEEYYFIKETKVCGYCAIKRISKGFYRVSVALKEFTVSIQEFTRVWGGYCEASKNDSKLVSNYKA